MIIHSPRKDFFLDRKQNHFIRISSWDGDLLIIYNKWFSFRADREKAGYLLHDRKGRKGPLNWGEYPLTITYLGRHQTKDSTISFSCM